ncbi:hypothetical protein CPLU01_04290 [Colletotrichum plurivorum]|uniref:Uncharacterized protein n=1 Tax=Colletotrichum plurivorum TaxID=2175906 RepID=A0A8H6KPM8_9PEZI|nr:hypothetical protein CPLU01_04290 [Colletotrichum plurivorum]
MPCFRPVMEGDNNNDKASGPAVAAAADTAGVRHRGDLWGRMEHASLQVYTWLDRRRGSAPRMREVTQSG